MAINRLKKYKYVNFVIFLYHIAFFVCFLILFFNLHYISHDQIETLIVFIVFGIFLFSNDIEADYFIIDFSDVLIYCLYLMYGAPIIYLFTGVYSVIRIFAYKIKYGSYRLKPASLNFIDDILTVFISSEIAENIIVPSFLSIELVQVLTFTVFVISIIVINMLLYSSGYYLLYKVKYIVKFDRDTINQIMSSLISAIFSYMFYIVGRNIGILGSYIFLMFACMTLCIYTVMLKARQENNLMGVLHTISKYLMKSDDIVSSLQNALTKMKEILNYRYAGIYVFSDKNDSSYPMVYSGNDIGDIVSLKLSKSIISDASGGEIYFLNSKEKDDFFLKLNYNENVMVIPLKESVKVMGCIIAVSAVKIKDNKIKLNAMDILAGYICLAIQNTDKYNRLKEIANTDCMTSLLNYRSFMDYIKQYVESKECFCLAIFDIDDFKKINDTYGHLAGNKVLREVAFIIKENMRFADICFRYGGEEFTVLFDGLGQYETMAICESIRKKIEITEFKCDDNTFKITISCGITEVNSKHAAAPETIFAVTDKALYESKLSGKNKTTFKSIN